MIPPLELFAYCLALCALFSVIYVPLGHLVMARIYPNCPEPLSLLASFGVSLLLYGVLVSLLLGVGIPNVVVSYLLAVVVLAVLGLWLKKGLYQVFQERNVRFGFAILFLYVFLCVLTTAFPTGNLREISVDTTMFITGLPVDNLIPYNGSRIILEHLHPANVDVVPDWKFTDRGPLAALANATVFLLLQLEETAPWLNVTPGLFFVYQTLLTYLNGLSLLAVWFLACHFFGVQAAIFSLLLLCSCYFYFLNVLFSWPKFLMAYFIVAAAYLWSAQRYWFLPGVFCALAWLSHDSAVFCVAVFCLAIVFDIWQQRRVTPGHEKSVHPFRFAAGLAGVMAPWLAFKSQYATDSSRLVHLLVFCNPDRSVAQGSLLEGFRHYLEKNSFGDILALKFSNLFYPFNPSFLYQEIAVNWKQPLLVANNMSHLSFFQIYLGLGVPFFLLFVLSFTRIRRDEALRGLLPTLFVAFGSLLPAVVIFGCNPGTVNHVWAYPAFLVAALAAGRLVATTGWWSTVLCAIGIATNLCLTAFYFHVKSLPAPFLHASPGYVLMQGIAISAMLVLLFWKLHVAEGSDLVSLRNRTEDESGKAIFMALCTMVLVLLLSVALGGKFRASHAPEVQGRVGGTIKKISSYGVDHPRALYMEQPKLSADGSRVLFNLWHQSGKAELGLWEEGVGYTSIHEGKDKNVIAASVSGDGTRVAFLEARRGKPEFYFYVWEDGFGVERLIESPFLGDWTSEFSYDGSRVLMIPGEGKADFWGAQEGGGHGNAKDQVFLIRLEGRSGKNASRGNRKSDPLRAIAQGLEPLGHPREVAMRDNKLFKLGRKRDYRKDGLEGETQQMERPDDEINYHRLAEAKKRTVLDFDADGISDLLVFATGTTYPVWRGYSLSGFDGPTKQVSGMSGQVMTWRFGHPGGVPVAGDYNGDGIIDLATFRPGMYHDWHGVEGNWQVYFSDPRGGSPVRDLVDARRHFQVKWGSGTAYAVPADYDGDGATDIGVFIPQIGKWELLFSGGGFSAAKANQVGKTFGASVAWGRAGDRPVTGDFDGDGRADLGVWRLREQPDKNGNPVMAGEWHISYLPDKAGNKRKSRILVYGREGDIPLPADYNCDGRSDIAIYRPGTGRWYIRFGEKSKKTFKWKVAGGLPFVDDFDGDGCADPAFFEPEGHFKWHIRNSQFPDEMRAAFPEQPPVVTKLRWGAVGELPAQVLLRQHQGFE